MITVECNLPSSDAALIFDEKGAKLIIEMIQELLEAGVQDHYHLLHGPPEHNGKPLREELHALSLTPIGTRHDSTVVEMLTLAFRPD